MTKEDKEELFGMEGRDQDKLGMHECVVKLGDSRAPQVEGHTDRSRATHFALSPANYHSIIDAH